jgi:hypothetical protein
MIRKSANNDVSLHSRRAAWSVRPWWVGRAPNVLPSPDFDPATRTVPKDPETYVLRVEGRSLVLYLQTSYILIRRVRVGLYP